MKKFGLCIAAACLLAAPSVFAMPPDQVEKAQRLLQQDSQLQTAESLLDTYVKACAYEHSQRRTCLPYQIGLIGWLGTYSQQVPSVSLADTAADFNTLTLLRDAVQAQIDGIESQLKQLGVGN